MKHVYFLLLMSLLTSGHLFASPQIIMQPGDSIVINPNDYTMVSCQFPNSGQIVPQADRCFYKRARVSSNGCVFLEDQEYFCVNFTYESYWKVIEKIKSLKAEGLCSENPFQKCSIKNDPTSSNYKCIYLDDQELSCWSSANESWLIDAFKKLKEEKICY